MKVLYLNGVDRSRDEATTRQLVDAEPSLDLTTASSPPDAFARIRESGDIDALVTSPAVARSETLALIVSLRRDKVPVVIVPVVTESQNEFATAAIAAGADDVLLQLGGTLLNAPETLSRVLKVQDRPKRDPKRLRALYVGSDDLVWTLLEQLPFVEAIRGTHEPGSPSPVGNPDAPAGSLGCDAVVIDALADTATQAEAVAGVRQQAGDAALIVLTPPSMSDEDASPLALAEGERIAKTGLYRRPLVTALERLNAKRHGQVPSTSASAAVDAPSPTAEPGGRAAPAIPAEPSPVEPETATDDVSGEPAAPEDAVLAAAAEAIEAARREWEREREELESRLAERESSLERMTVEHDETTGRLARELDELATVRGHLDAALEATRAELRESRERYERDTQKRQEAIERLQDQVASIEEARRVERARWEENAGSLEHRLRGAAAAAARAEFETTVEAGKAELRRAEQHHADDRAKWDAARTELTERISRLEGVEATRKALERQLQDARDELGRAETAAEALRRERDDAKAAVDAVRAEGNELRAMRNAASRDAERARAERDTLRSELEAMRAERDAAAAERETVAAERDAHRTSVSAAETALREAQAAADTLRGELEQVRQDALDARAGRDAIDAALRQARADAEGLQTAALERDALGVELDSAHAERSEARAERDAAHAERDQLRTALDATRADHDGLRLERDGLLAERDEARRSLETQRAERDQAWAEADAARSERDGLRSELDRAIRELEQAREALAREGAERAAEAAAATDDRARWETERAGWETERRDFDELVRHTERKAADARRELEAAFASTRGELEGALDTTRAELDAEREASESARADLERVRQELQAALDEARAALEEARAGERRAADAHAAALAVERDAATAARRDLAASRTHLEEAGRWHDAQRAAWDAARAELERELAALRDELQATRGDLETRLAAAELRAQDLSVQLAGQPAAIAAARAAAEEAHRRFVRRGMFGHAITTRTGHVLECNDAFARLFGHAGAAELLRHYADRPFAPMTDREALDARLMANGHAHGVDSCLERTDGQPIRVLESAARLEDPARGELIERVLIDMSDYARLEDQLQRARRIERVGTLASEMGPDIEASLAAALAAVRQAAATVDPAARGGLHAAAEAAHRAAGLVHQLLAFSRRQQRATESIDLSAVVAGAADMLRRLAGADTSLEIRAEEPLSITAAADDVSQLLTALAVQARDLLPLGGTVRVSAEMAPARTSESGLHARHIVLRVAASGYGVGTPQVTEALDAMADRCGGSISARHDAGREAGFDVAFARCVPGPHGAAR